MPSINDSKHDEATDASWEATRGAISGAVKWGIGTAILGGLGYAMSPVYRGLTIQFKVYVPPLLHASPDTTIPSSSTIASSSVFRSIPSPLLYFIPIWGRGEGARLTRIQVHPNVGHGAGEHARGRPQAADVRGKDAGAAAGGGRAGVLEEDCEGAGRGRRG